MGAVGKRFQLIFDSPLFMQESLREGQLMGKEPVLVVMAAGLGSRFGGLKQIYPVDEQGHILIDFALCDARKVGFRKVVFIIKKNFEEAFRERIGNRMERFFEVSYVFQELDRLPEGFRVPLGREKPWGTAHAIACCRDEVDAPFAVINADDFYGAGAFQAVYRFLKETKDEDCYAMVGYRLRNTVTENGSVARGVCEVEEGMLSGITERTKIWKDGENARYTLDGEEFVPLFGGTIVSMNLWGFSKKILDVLWEKFPEYLRENLPVNPLKCEYFLPTVVNEQLKAGSARVKVLPCEETWYGVTYYEDLQPVMAAIHRMKEQGIYSQNVWD